MVPAVTLLLHYAYMTQKSMPMVLWRMYSKHRWHIYGTVHLKVGKYRLLQ